MTWYPFSIQYTQNIIAWPTEIFKNNCWILRWTSVSGERTSARFSVLGYLLLLFKWEFTQTSASLAIVHAIFFLNYKENWWRWWFIIFVHQLQKNTYSRIPLKILRETDPFLIFLVLPNQHENTKIKVDLIIWPYKWVIRHHAFINAFCC